MGAPITTGRYVNSLSGMGMDDYIKCVYEAPYANVAGYFSQLGNKTPWMEVHTTTTVDGVEGETVITKEEYSELPTTPSTTCSGFFFLIKVDYGMLIADRLVQTAISWESLNKKNYIYGGAFDTVNSRTLKEVDIVITHKEYSAETDGSANTDTTTTTTGETEFNDYSRKIRTTYRKQIEIDTGNNRTTTTETTTTWHYAYIPDVLPDKIVNAIPPEMISIPYDAEVTDLSAVLDQVTTVTCTVKKDDGTTYTHDVAVTWDYSTFQRYTVDAQIIYGTLADMDIDPDHPMQNPDEIKASCVVKTQVDQVVSVNNFDDITIRSNVAKSELATLLATTYPTCTVTYQKYGTENTESKENVPVTWDFEPYNVGVVGEQFIEGTFNVTNYGIGNDDDIVARVKIITEPAPTPEEPTDEGE